MSESEERLLAMVTALTAELAVTRERVDTLERLLESAGVCAQTDVENFSPAAAAFDERQRMRRRLIGKVFRPLEEAAERDLREARQAVASGERKGDQPSAASSTGEIQEAVNE